ncbi:MAG TPA: hypothetical protein VFS40_00270 [Gemmatimonadales bacterium]|nr:hypothetical protein [Gemmatimonadales bacterium]
MPHRPRWMLSLALAAALAACGDGSTTDPGDGGEITPIPTAVGQPTGAAVTATIGPEGGTLASADGKLTVTVPAGAVSAATTFSVQPVENLAHGALRDGVGGYGLEPHGTTFARPVTLTFHYEAADLDGTAPALLGLASQDDRGYWWLWPGATVDAAQHTVSVEAPHFSHWSLVAGARIYPDEYSVETDQTIPVRVHDCRKPPVPAGSKEPIGYECTTTTLFGSAKNWSVNGRVGGHTGTTGRITRRDAEPGVADFRAPPEVPAENPVTVSVEYTGQNPADRALLITEITIFERGQACAPLRDVARWTATFGMSYGFSGTNADGQSLTLSQAGQVTSTLVKLSEGPGGVSWIGPLDGTVSVDDREVWPVPSSPPFVTTLVGSGVPVNNAEVPEEKAHVYLNVNLDACTWNAGVAYWGEATQTETDQAPSTSARFLGSARLADRPITSLTAAGFTGSVNTLARSEGWALDNDGDAYFPGGLGDRLFSWGYATEGQAGTAQVEWSFAPVQ